MLCPSDKEGLLVNFAFAGAPRTEVRCPCCRDTGLVRISEPVAPPAPIGDRAPTARDALEWGAWLLKCRLCTCAEAVSA